MNIDTQEKSIYEDKDLEKIPMVLESVKGLLKELGEVFKDVINTVMNAVKGDVIGKEIASFYKDLKESGMPDDIVLNMTREFLRQKFEVVTKVSSLLQILGKYTESKEQHIESKKLVEIANAINSIADSIPDQETKKRLKEIADRLRSS